MRDLVPELRKENPINPVAIFPVKKGAVIPNTPGRDLPPRTPEKGQLQGDESFSELEKDEVVFGGKQVVGVEQAGVAEKEAPRLLIAPFPVGETHYGLMVIFHLPSASGSMSVSIGGAPPSTLLQEVNAWHQKIYKKLAITEASLKPITPTALPCENIQGFIGSIVTHLEEAEGVDNFPVWFDGVALGLAINAESVLALTDDVAGYRARIKQVEASCADQVRQAEEQVAQYKKSSDMVVQDAERREQELLEEIKVVNARLAGSRETTPRLDDSVDLNTSQVTPEALAKQKKINKELEALVKRSTKAAKVHQDAAASAEARCERLLEQLSTLQETSKVFNQQSSRDLESLRAENEALGEKIKRLETDLQASRRESGHWMEQAQDRLDEEMASLGGRGGLNVSVMSRFESCMTPARNLRLSTAKKTRGRLRRGETAVKSRSLASEVKAAAAEPITHGVVPPMRLDFSAAGLQQIQDSPPSSPPPSGARSLSRSEGGKAFQASNLADILLCLGRLSGALDGVYQRLLALSQKDFVTTPVDTLLSLAMRKQKELDQKLVIEKLRQEQARLEGEARDAQQVAKVTIKGAKASMTGHSTDEINAKLKAVHQKYSGYHEEFLRVSKILGEAAQLNRAYPALIDCQAEFHQTVQQPLLDCIGKGEVLEADVDENADAIILNIEKQLESVRAFLANLIANAPRIKEKFVTTIIKSLNAEHFREQIRAMGGRSKHDAKVDSSAANVAMLTIPAFSLANPALQTDNAIQSLVAGMPLLEIDDVLSLLETLREAINELAYDGSSTKPNIKKSCDDVQHLMDHLLHAKTLYGTGSMRELRGDDTATKSAAVRDNVVAEHVELAELDRTIQELLEANKINFPVQLLSAVHHLQTTFCHLFGTCGLDAEGDTLLTQADITARIKKNRAAITALKRNSLQALADIKLDGNLVGKINEAIGEFVARGGDITARLLTIFNEAIQPAAIPTFAGSRARNFTSVLPSVASAQAAGGRPGSAPAFSDLS